MNEIIIERNLMANPLAVDGTNSKYKQLGANTAGFWAGVWHGLIAPIVFIVTDKEGPSRCIPK